MANYEKINPKMVQVAINPGEQVYARRGAMLAYQGEVRFAPTMTAGAGVGGFVGRMVAGEQVPLMACEGRGKVLYGHAGLNVTVVPINHDQLTVEADKLLCYDGVLQAGTMFLGQQGGLRAVVQGQMTGQGLFTTKVHGQGSVALLSHGGAVPLALSGETVGVDPQAYVAHTGPLNVELSAKVGLRDAVGRGSGEAFQLHVSGHGTVYVQPSERRF